MAGLRAAALAAMALVSPAGAETCAEAFDRLGRTYVADAPLMEPEGGILPSDGPDCPAGHWYQFSFDLAATQAATKVTEADRLVGTWLADDILLQVAGIAIPVLEVLKIARGSEPGQVRIEQRLYRANDPADWFDHSDFGSVDVVAAGRVALYGETTARLVEPGTLAPTRVRYHDFPLELSRSTELLMKARYLSFMTLDGLDVRTDGGRLVFFVKERHAAPDLEVRTYLGVPPEVPDQALQLVLVGEISMLRFPCLVQAIGEGTEAFAAALGGIERDTFLHGLDKIYRTNSEFRALEKAIRELPAGTSTRLLMATAASKAKELNELRRGPVGTLIAQVRAHTPFGCPAPM